jgi:serine/threonine protein kinase
MQIGQYKLTHRVGAGGMGTVFRALDSRGAPVAVKFIGSQAQVDATLHAAGPAGNLSALDPHHRMMLVREARLAMGLSHRNIVYVSDYNQHEGLLYIVMEYLDGRSLEKVIPVRAGIPIPTRCGLIRQLCEALDYAHRQGVIHRDVKPSNCFVLQNGRLKVLDFGIAASADQHPGQIQLVGTLPYMAPELFGSFPRYTEKVDIWAAGVTLYQLLTGRPPFMGRSRLELQANVARQSFPSLPESLPFARELGWILDRALAKDPAQRYASAAEFAYELSLLEKPEEAVVAPSRKPPKRPAEDPWWATKVVQESDLTSPLPNAPAHAVSGISGKNRTGHKIRFIKYDLKTAWLTKLGILFAGLYALHLMGGWRLDVLPAPWAWTLPVSICAFVIPILLAGSVVLWGLAFREKLAATPRCRRCGAIARHQSGLTVFAYTKTSLRHASSDCIAALHENLWDDAPKLLSMHGELKSPKSGQKTSHPPLRLHLDFYACLACEDKMALLTTDDRLSRSWIPRDEYEGACKTSNRPVGRLPFFARWISGLKAGGRAARAAAEPVSPLFGAFLIACGILIGIFYYPQFPIVLDLPGYRTIITIRTEPPGHSIYVDGQKIPTPHTFKWAVISNHTIEFNSQIGVNGHVYECQGIIPSPSNMKPPLRWPSLVVYHNTVTRIDAPRDRWGRLIRPASDITYTVQYAAENDLSSTNSWATPNAFQDSRLVRNNAIPEPGSTQGTGTRSPEGTPTIVVTSRPPGLAVVVDGVQVITPRSYKWPVGSYHTLEVPAEHQTKNPAGTLPPDVYANGAWDFGSKEGSNRVHIDWSMLPFPTTYTAKFHRVPAAETSASQGSAHDR